MPDEHPAITDVRAKAEALAESLQTAVDAGIGPAIILPELMRVFRASGLPLPGKSDVDSARQQV